MNLSVRIMERICSTLTLSCVVQLKICLVPLRRECMKKMIRLAVKMHGIHHVAELFKQGELSLFELEKDVLLLLIDSEKGVDQFKERYDKLLEMKWLKLKHFCQICELTAGELATMREDLEIELAFKKKWKERLYSELSIMTSTYNSLQFIEKILGRQHSSDTPIALLKMEIEDENTATKVLMAGSVKRQKDVDDSQQAHQVCGLRKKYTTCYSKLSMEAVILPHEFCQCKQTIECFEELKPVLFTRKLGKKATPENQTEISFSLVAELQGTQQQAPSSEDMPSDDMKFSLQSHDIVKELRAYLHYRRRNDFVLVCRVTMGFVMLVMPLLLIQALLLMSGDVEVNPGPGKREMSELGVSLRSHYAELCEAVTRRPASSLLLADSLYAAELIHAEARMAVKGVHSHLSHMAIQRMLEVATRKAQNSLPLSLKLCECLQQSGIQLPHKVLSAMRVMTVSADRAYSGQMKVMDHSQMVQDLVNVLNQKNPSLKLIVHSLSKTLTAIVESLLVQVLTVSLPEHLKLQAKGKKLSEVLALLGSRMEHRFLFLCYLASRSLNGPDLTLQQASNCMLNFGTSGKDILLGFEVLVEVVDGKYMFSHFLIKAFLAAVHHLFRPGMNTVMAMTRNVFDAESLSLPLSEEGCFALQFFSGLTPLAVSQTASVSLRHIIGQLCSEVNGSRPVQEKLSVEIFLLVLRCAFEANDSKLCVMIDRECLTAQTVVVDVDKVDVNVLSFFIAKTTKHDHYWTVYSPDEYVGVGKKIQDRAMEQDGLLLVKPVMNCHEAVLVFSTKTYESLATSVLAFGSRTGESKSLVKAFGGKRSDRRMVTSDCPLQADEFHGRRRLATHEVLRAYNTELVSLMENPGLVANHLLRDGVISSSSSNDILLHSFTRYERAEKILETIERGMSDQGENVMLRFVTALERSNELALKPVVACIKEMLPKCTASSLSKGMKAFPLYGYQTETHYKALQQMETSVFFKLVKDALLPYLQLHSPGRFVEGEYRKMDHVCFKLSQTMRNSFYTSFKLSPLISIHWTKVQAPDGSDALEVKYRQEATLSSVGEVQGSRMAEMIFLNSTRLDKVSILVPASNEEVTVQCYVCDDTVLDQGMIGCDYMKPEYEAKPCCVPWIASHPFDVKTDQQVGRELPLPSQKAEMAVSTPVDGVLTLGEQPRGQIVGRTPPISQVSRRDPHVMGESMPRPHTTITAQRNKWTESDVEESSFVSEQEVRRVATESFNRPGVCFFTDGRFFRSNKVYHLPDTLSTCRILREGGNGIVLEMKYEGEQFAVKKTAFRWREILIMTKLRHRNILPLGGLIMGKPVELHPNRRYVYQFSPRFTNDLGRIVGSFEKYCLRTLCERYSSERLLLSKVHANFRYVAREILKALAYLHSRPSPIVHRDVKLSNVLVQMHCDCHNPLVCVCRRQADIVLGDFDASLELSSDSTLPPDTPRPLPFGYLSSPSTTFHVSPVGTLGYKSPEGSQYAIGNNLYTMPPLTTKADIFSFGVLVSLLFINEEGPKHQKQMAKLLLSVNQTVASSQLLTMDKLAILRRHGIEPRVKQIYVSEDDVYKELPLRKVKKELGHIQGIHDFLCKSLAVDPRKRSSAFELLHHPYLAAEPVLVQPARVKLSTGSRLQRLDGSKSALHIAASFRGSAAMATHFASSSEACSTSSSASVQPWKVSLPFSELLCLEVLPLECSSVLQEGKLCAPSLKLPYRKCGDPLAERRTPSYRKECYVKFCLEGKEKKSKVQIRYSENAAGMERSGDMWSSFLTSYFQSVSHSLPSEVHVEVPMRIRLFIGAPGTGQTMLLDRTCNQQKVSERILHVLEVFASFQRDQEYITKTSALERVSVALSDNIILNSLNRMSFQHKTGLPTFTIESFSSASVIEHQLCKCRSDKDMSCFYLESMTRLSPLLATHPRIETKAHDVKKHVPFCHIVHDTQQSSANKHHSGYCFSHLMNDLHLAIQLPLSEKSVSPRAIEHIECNPFSTHSGMFFPYLRHILEMDLFATERKSQVKYITPAVFVNKKILQCKITNTFPNFLEDADCLYSFHVNENSACNPAHGIGPNNNVQHWFDGYMYVDDEIVSDMCTYMHVDLKNISFTKKCATRGFLPLSMLREISFTTESLLFLASSMQEMMDRLSLLVANTVVDNSPVRRSLSPATQACLELHKLILAEEVDEIREISIEVLVNCEVLSVPFKLEGCIFSKTSLGVDHVYQSGTYPQGFGLAKALQQCAFSVKHLGHELLLLGCFMLLTCIAIQGIANSIGGGKGVKKLSHYFCTAIYSNSTGSSARAYFTKGGSYKCVKGYDMVVPQERMERNQASFVPVTFCERVFTFLHWNPTIQFNGRTVVLNVRRGVLKNHARASAVAGKSSVLVPLEGNMSFLHPEMNGLGSHSLTFTSITMLNPLREEELCKKAPLFVLDEGTRAPGILEDFHTPTSLHEWWECGLVLHIGSTVIGATDHSEILLLDGKRQSVDTKFHQMTRKRRAIHILLQGRPRLKMTTLYRKFYCQIKEGIVLQYYTLVARRRPSMESFKPVTTSDIIGELPVACARHVVHSQQSTQCNKNGGSLLCLCLEVSPCSLPPADWKKPNDASF